MPGSIILREADSGSVKKFQSFENKPSNVVQIKTPRSVTSCICTLKLSQYGRVVSQLFENLAAGSTLTGSWREFIMTLDQNYMKSVVRFEHLLDVSVPWIAIATEKPFVEYLIAACPPELSLELVELPSVHVLRKSFQNLGAAFESDPTKRSTESVEEGMTICKVSH
ncbi:hypothetical protein B0H14DRAFT_3610091 [Mycena olivaceomarginata]|nr:hypothetical protein B0H14DRAFT_3610091 [Mycena olivaceomarginata]